MPKELEIYITDEVSVGDSPVVTITTHSIVRATPNSGNLPTYVRLHDYVSGINYLWNGDPYEVDETTPLDHPNWIPE